jgi:O-antigen/teichoic acid export membrane protein
MDATSIVARGALVTLLGQWAKFMVQIVSIAALSRLLGPEVLGKYAMIIAVAGIATVISDFGLSLAAIREKNLTQNQQSNLFWLNVAVGAIATCVVYLSAGLTAAIYGDESLVPVVQLLACIFVLNGLAAQFRAWHNRKLRFRVLAVADVTSQLGGLFVGVLAAASGFGVWSLAWQQIAAAAIALVIPVAAARWWPSLPSRHDPFLHIVSFGTSTTITQVMNYASSNVDSVMIGRIWGASTVGVYSRAFQLFALPLQQLAAPITRVALPVLAAAESHDQFRRRLIRGHRALSYVLLGAIAYLAGAAEPIVNLLLGPGWSDASTYLRILAIGGVFQALGYVYYWACLAKAKMRTLMLCEAGGRTVMVSLIVLLVSLGPAYVALGYTLGLFSIWIFTSLLAGRAVGVSPRAVTRAALRPTAIMLVAAVVAHCASGVGEKLLAPVLVQLTMATIAYMLVLLASTLWRGARSDYRDLLTLAKRSVAGVSTEHNGAGATRRTATSSNAGIG